MRKLFSIVIVSLFALSTFAANYGILVNGKTYFQAEYKGKDSMTGTYDEYLAHVKVKAGDYCQLYDAEFQARWAVDLDTYSVAGFVRDGDKYTVSVTGCYDFYIKLKYEADQLYIGNGLCCEGACADQGSERRRGDQYNGEERKENVRYRLTRAFCCAVLGNQKFLFTGRGCDPSQEERRKWP